MNSNLGYQKKTHRDSLAVGLYIYVGSNYLS